VPTPAPRAQPPEPTVLTAWTGTLLRALTELGVDARGLAAQAGITNEELEDPDHRIPLDASTRLWRAAVAHTGQPTLGLDVSRYVRPGTFHTLGHAVITSPTLRDALHRVARYSAITADVADARVEETTSPDGGDVVTLVLTWRPGAERPAFEPVDAVLAAIVRTARFMLDRDVNPHHATLERPAPAEGHDATRFAQVFRCPLTFGAADNRLSFTRADADRSVAGGNPEIAKLHDDVTAAYLARLEPTTTARLVRRVLPDLLPGGEPSIAATAAALATSPRTLQRQLQDEGTSYREVLRDVRRDLAIGYLQGGGHSVTEITYLLGFRETAAFSRAFKQWTGSAPSRYRSPTS
jgi:AraC-like DNA-binding protein